MSIRKRRAPKKKSSPHLALFNNELRRGDAKLKSKWSFIYQDRNTGDRVFKCRQTGEARIFPCKQQ